METASGKRRRQLQTQIAETQGELELAQARSDAMHNMAVFVRGASSNRPGATGLQTQIDALAAAVPAVSAPSNSSEPASSSKEQLHPALVAPVNKPSSSGIWDLTADLLVLSQKAHTVEVAIQQTNALARKSAEIRAP